MCVCVCARESISRAARLLKQKRPAAKSKLDEERSCGFSSCWRYLNCQTPIVSSSADSTHNELCWRRGPRCSRQRARGREAECSPLVRDVLPPKQQQWQRHDRFAQDQEGSGKGEIEL